MIRVSPSTPLSCLYTFVADCKLTMTGYQISSVWSKNSGPWMRNFGQKDSESNLIRLLIATIAPFWSTEWTWLCMKCQMIRIWPNKKTFCTISAFYKASYKSFWPMARTISRNLKASLCENSSQRWCREKARTLRCLTMMICAVYNLSSWIKKMIEDNSQIVVVILIARIANSYVQRVRDREGMLLTAS